MDATYLIESGYFFILVPVKKNVPPTLYCFNISVILVVCLEGPSSKVSATLPSGILYDIVSLSSTDGIMGSVKDAASTIIVSVGIKSSCTSSSAPLSSDSAL